MTRMEIINFPDTVLVVDDEPIVLQICSRILPSFGMQVVTAKTAEEAFEHLHDEGFGCVLTDKNLPGADGVEVLRETRRLQPHAACIMMTGYSSVDSAVEALRLGANDYLTKPFDDIELIAQKVQLAIKNQRAQFERDELLQRVRAFQSELRNAGGELEQQRTEIEMFNEVLEERVKQATMDLRAERDELQNRISSGIPRAEAEIVGVEMAIILLRDLQRKDTPASAELRGELARVLRQLEAYVAVLRKTAKGD
ncbi:MAG TPA: response regulator [Myxococcales bacterium]|nr:response regulator [Myxococcales bacterium]